MTNDITRPSEPSTRSRAWPWLALGTVAIGVLCAAAYWATTSSDPQPKPAPVDPLPRSPTAPEGPPWFRDRTADTAIDFTYRNGADADNYTMLEQLGGGVGMIDFDGDGLLDLFFPGGGTFDGEQIKGLPCRFYKNLGDWKFRDVTTELGLDKIDFYTHGCAVADFDRDGRPDLLVTGWGRVALFRNADGKRFVDVTAKAGLDDRSWSTSAGWADLTGSGFPDLYLCHYVNWSFANHPFCKGQSLTRDNCGPRDFKPLAHTLYRNQRDGAFRDVSKEQGIGAGAGLGVVLADFNDDGKPDIFVANDQTVQQLYLNRAGKLEEKGLLAGIAVDEHGNANGSMGVDVADYDGSGRPSVLVTNYQGQMHGLYRNAGKEQFFFQSRIAGLGTLSRHFVGFGTSFLDVDNDGWEDALIVNGHVLRKPLAGSPQQKPLLLRNTVLQGQRAFQDYTKRGGSAFDTPTLGRGMAVGDLDNDGWPDVVISATNTPAVLLRNEASTGNPAHWLGIRLVGKMHRDVAGATLVLQTDTRALTRFCKGGGSYLSSGDRRILFGLGTSGKAGLLTVKWPWGQTQTWDKLEPNRYWVLHEGVPEAKER